MQTILIRQNKLKFTAVNAYLQEFSRTYSSAPVKTLRERVTELVPEKREEVKKVKAEHGNKQLGIVNVDMVTNQFIFHV